jgi:NarL family two-component system response regulator LiaR
MNEKVRLLIADDHAVVREGLRNFIAIQPEIEIIGEAGNGLEAVEMESRLKPDVILMDLVMPKKNGIEAIREIKKRNPDARILVITSFAEDNMVIPAIKAGALGYLLKDSSPQQLLQAIRDVNMGVLSFSQGITKQLMRELNRPIETLPKKDKLTDREIEILKQSACGRTNQEIAANLVISEWTVRTHISNILSKLELSNRTQAVLYALREGLVTLDDCDIPSS